jgi:hypothetical protein
MKLDKKELKEIVECIDFVSSNLRMTHKIYKLQDNSDYEFGYLNYLVELRNKIVMYFNDKR